MQSVANKNCWPRTGLYFVYRCDFYYRSRNVYTCLHVIELDCVRRLERKNWKRKTRESWIFAFDFASFRELKSIDPFARQRVQSYRSNCCWRVCLWWMVNYNRMGCDGQGCNCVYQKRRRSFVSQRVVSQQGIFTNSMKFRYDRLCVFLFISPYSEYGDRTNLDRSFIDA